MRVYQFREFGKDFHNFVRTFTTSCDNYDVSFCLLGDSVLKHSLTGTERTRDKTSTTFYNRIYSIDYTNTCFQQFKWTWFFLIVGHRLLYRPLLNHVHRNIVAFLVSQHYYCIFNGIFTGSHDRLYLISTLQLERYHNLQRLVIFFYLTQPRRWTYFITYLYQWFEMPLAFLIQRISVLTALQEHAVHLVEVILQTIVVFRQHTRTQSHFEHVSCKFGFGTYLQSTCTFEHLNIYVAAYHLDYFRHQTVAAGQNVTDFILGYRTIHGKCNHVGNYATNSSFCCHILFSYLFSEF